MGVAVNTVEQSKRGGGGRGDTERLDTMPSTNGKAAHIRARWIEGEALRQLRFGLTYRQIASVLTALARGEMTPATAGIDLPPDVTFPPGYSINHQRVFELVKHALDRFPMLEAQALRTLWMTRYEEAWAHLQPGMRKGNPRAIEVGMRVAERAAKLAGLDMPTKVAVRDPDGKGIPLEAIRMVLQRWDEQAQTVESTALPASTSKVNGNGDGG
jgi:hypothetical protein